MPNQLHQTKLNICTLSSKNILPNLKSYIFESPFGIAKAWIDQSTNQSVLYRLDLDSRGVRPKRLKNTDISIPKFWKETTFNPKKPSTSSEAVPSFVKNLFATRETIAICLVGSPNQIKAWQGLVNLKWGETISYIDFGEKIFGSRKYARVVGNLIGKNPIPWFIPCHRVLSSSGALGGFGCGLDIKKEMLHTEKLSD